MIKVLLGLLLGMLVGLAAMAAGLFIIVGHTTFQLQDTAEAWEAVAQDVKAVIEANK